MPSTDKRTPETYQARKLTLNTRQFKREGFQCISKEDQDNNLLFHLYERQIKRKKRNGARDCSRWAASRSCVGAVECNEAAIFPQPLESQAKDQKIKRSQPSAAPTASGSKHPRHNGTVLRLRLAWPHTSVAYTPSFHPTRAGTHRSWRSRSGPWCAYPPARP